jgi:hypothetical protein
MISKTYKDQVVNSSMANPTKTCPRCSVVAKSIKQVDEIFGLRNSGGHVIAQSLCRLCRSSHARQVRAFKAENPKLAGKDLREKQGKGKKATLLKVSVGKKLSHVVKTKAKKIKAKAKKQTANKKAVKKSKKVASLIKSHKKSKKN